MHVRNTKLLYCLTCSVLTLALHISAGHGYSVHIFIQIINERLMRNSPKIKSQTPAPFSSTPRMLYSASDSNAMSQQIGPSLLTPTSTSFRRLANLYERARWPVAVYGGRTQLAVGTAHPVTVTGNLVCLQSMPVL